MINYSNWKERLLSVVNTKLDPDNPRMPSYLGDNPSQRALIQEMVEHEKIHELAKNIVENGYFPIELLICIKEGNKYVVVEGNRRLTALKLLVSPESAPSNKISTYRALSRRINIDSIKKVKTIIAPSREDANRIIMIKHTRPQIEKWEPLMKAQFYYNMLQRGTTIEELKEEYKVSETEILKFLRQQQMYKLACELDLPNEIKEKVHDPRYFPITTLEDRIYSRAKVQQFLGIKFHDTKLEVYSDYNEFQKIYSKIVSDIATKRKDSRNLNTNKQINDYLDDLKDYEPNKDNIIQKNFFPTFPTNDSNNVQVNTEIKTKTKKNNITKKSTGIIPLNKECHIQNQRINNVFNELQKVSVSQYPNATAILFRGLLEMCLSNYLSKSNHLVLMKKTALNKLKNNQRLQKDWHPTLQEMLKYIIDEKHNLINNANIVKVVNKLLHEKDNRFSLNSLNLFTHNEYYPPDENILRNFWSQLEGLFDIILVDPDNEE